jgi:hypothetical protein
MHGAQMVLDAAPVFHLCCAQAGDQVGYDRPDRPCIWRIIIHQFAVYKFAEGKTGEQPEHAQCSVCGISM